MLRCLFSKISSSKKLNDEILYFFNCSISFKPSSSIKGMPSLPIIFPDLKIRSSSIKFKDNKIVLSFAPLSIKRLFIPLLAKSLKMKLKYFQENKKDMFCEECTLKAPNCFV